MGFSLQLTIDDLNGPKLITPTVFRDERGYFFESYSQPSYKEVFVQDNVAFSKKGTIRALHYQSDPGQAKLVSCLRGKIWDVVVDLRPKSVTFGMWAAVTLDDEMHQQLLVPNGFAHGYCVRSDEALVQYKVSSLYNPDAECSIRFNDPTLNIAWGCEEPILSERDQNSPFFSQVFS